MSNRKKDTVIPAIYSDTSLDEGEAITTLSSILIRTKRIHPNLSRGDKEPNYDGYITLLQNTFAVGTFKVQVKKLRKNFQGNKYTFTDGGKFFAACLSEVDKVPILFIGVDITNPEVIAYWRYMSKDYLYQLKSSKTVTFEEKFPISNKRLEYIDEWFRIRKEYNDSEVISEELKKIYSVISKVTSPALAVKDNNFIVIHKFLDLYNDKTRIEYPIIKNTFFPKQWKIGMAYSEFTEKTVAYCLYPIPFDYNDVQIKFITPEIKNWINEEVHSKFIHYFKENPFLSDYKKHVNTTLKDNLEFILEHKLLDHKCSEYLAREFIFACIEKFELQLGLEKKPEYSIEELEFAVGKYLPIWVDTAIKYISDSVSNGRQYLENILRRSNGLYPLDSLKFLLSTTQIREEIKLKVENRLIKKNSDEFVYPITDDKLPIKILFDFISYLKGQEIRIIKDVYKPKDWSKLDKDNSIYNIYSKKDLKENISIFFENLVESYSSIVKINFPQLQKKLSIFQDASLILVDVYVYNGLIPFPSATILYLKSKEVCKKRIEVIIEETNEGLYQQDLFNKSSIEYQGVEYDILSWSDGNIDFMYEETPMLNYIYSKINKLIKEVLR